MERKDATPVAEAGDVQLVEVEGQIDAKALSSPPRPKTLPLVVVAGRTGGKRDATSLVAALPDPKRPIAPRRWFHLRPLRSVERKWLVVGVLGLGVFFVVAFVVASTGREPIDEPVATAVDRGAVPPAKEPGADQPRESEPTPRVTTKPHPEPARAATPPRAEPTPQKPRDRRSREPAVVATKPAAEIEPRNTVKPVATRTVRSSAAPGTEAAEPDKTRVELQPMPVPGPEKPVARPARPKPAVKPVKTRNTKKTEPKWDPKSLFLKGP